MYSLTPWRTSGRSGTRIQSAFDLIKDTEYTTILHLADNTTVFQIGANEGEDMGVNIGDMSARSLGVTAFW
jgi:hypothetical protein